MKNILQYTFTSLWIIGVAIALYVASNWNSTTALFPKSVGYPMLALLIAILVIDILKGRRQKEKGATTDDEEDDFPARNRCMVVYLGWLVGFALLVWAISITYAIPIYIFAYMKIQGKYSWLKSGLYAVAATAFIYLLFQYAFSVSWPDGELQTMLGL